MNANCSQLHSRKARDTGADLQAGLLLAEALLRGRPHPQVVLFSDGGFDEAALRKNLRRSMSALSRCHQARLRPGDGNAAITSFAVRRYRRNRLSYEVLLQLSYFPSPQSPPGKTATLELRQEEGELVDVQKLDLVPGEQTRKLYPSLSGAGTHLQATLKLEGGEVDLLPLDNHAYAVLPSAGGSTADCHPGICFWKARCWPQVPVKKITWSSTRSRHPITATTKRPGTTRFCLMRLRPRPPDVHAIYLDPQGCRQSISDRQDGQRPVSVGRRRTTSGASLGVAGRPQHEPRVGVPLGPFDRPLAKMIKDLDSVDCA